MAEKYYKTLNEGDKSTYQGAEWSLPTKNDDGTWTPGEWMPEIKGELAKCKNGYHVCTAEQLIGQLNASIYEVEADGDVVACDEECICRRARLTRKVEQWNNEAAILFACDCAERVLHIYEKQHENDNRPRTAVEVARKYASGEATADELAAAGNAARAAARAATSAAAEAAAEAAAWVAAWVAARAATEAAGSDAAWVAARDAAEAATEAAGSDAAWVATSAAAEAAAWVAARDAAWVAARYAARDAASVAARDAAWVAARYAARDAASVAAEAAAWVAAWVAERKWQTEQLWKYLKSEAKQCTGI